MLLNSNQRFGVDYMIDEHNDKWIIQSKILFKYIASLEATIWSWLYDRRTQPQMNNSKQMNNSDDDSLQICCLTPKQRFGVHYMIDEQTTNE